ncbi:MAG: hypothetical protein KDD01_26995 [Phaeodactylibacter sp.]|nr:hypothetical protein [Phaeodactylibacter sp.]
MKRVLLLLLTISAMIMLSAQDQVILRSGKELDVDILFHSHQKVVVKTETGKTTLPSDNIGSIHLREGWITANPISVGFFGGNTIIGDPSFSYSNNSIVSKILFPLTLSVEYLLQPQHGIGILGGRTNKGKDLGFYESPNYPYSRGWEMNYKSYSLFIYYKWYLPAHRINFFGGLGIQDCKYAPSSYYYFPDLKRTNVLKPGLLAGAEVSLKELRRSGFRLSLQYRFSSPVSIGPFLDEYNDVFFPKQNVNFSHFFLGFNYSRKFRVKG